MSQTQKPYRFIISGGGTGGHIFPALAIADQIKLEAPDSEILFVGAESKMEMQKVPEAGYKILGLPIAGIQRSLTLKNLAFPFKLLNSLRQAKKIVKNFKPDAVIGVGGYASGPTLRAASNAGIPCFLQEQNSYAGLTNKWLKNKVQKICVAYEGMEKYFPASKLQITGNPVRKGLMNLPDKETALKHYKLSAETPVILVLGGSLGARVINESVMKHLPLLKESNVQMLWQTGKLYHQEMLVRANQPDNSPIKVLEFIKEMEMAYATADIIVSRAGALSVSELAIIGKPVIFVPSSGVAEDHQTKNANSLVQKDAAILVTDQEAVEVLIPKALDLLEDEELKNELATNIKKLARPNATEDIVKIIFSMIK
ncbi:undecaprenyldiphospho-muramoylpentapeptide beta-N-acetylglucosaminyltransferase [Marivirga sp. S37H4]|uniref:UDP-N-acetylglucosamine--N-acetylmuramyl-(pentapeptide) pyrophosphoryl-undecaprenol N-acetylglucosamine transferase n=1 Tax=Marivirga aurantiaca TaxID=2802615 RepID=A0A934X1Y7_9BACT|nr:undecaprenyldiphospho-muramoylpentapeptide beta-N-acetylglucosaminyltransferase [Marivirga aurantiaca]MBK6266962.1 undecaprenyldiphospho-muramoylpentapeptide beta-N-acetylglucosaminyltransferase [Marivirga aurantiaca]